MNISNNLFLNNTSEEGGGITYNKGKPLLLSNNTFKYNFAYYGLNVSSFPIRVNLTNQNHENIFFWMLLDLLLMIICLKTLILII